MGYVRQVLATAIVRAALIPVGLLYAVLLARVLGPRDLGIFMAIGAFLATAVQIGNLGIPTAVLRHAGARPADLDALVANARVSGAAVGVVSIAALAALSFSMPAALGEVQPGLLVLAAASLPATFVSGQLLTALLGAGRVRAYNAIDVTNRLLLLGGSALVLLGLGGGVLHLVLLAVALSLAQVVLYHLALGPAARRMRPDLPLLRRLAGVSSRAYLTNALTHLVLKSDLLLISALLGGPPTGLYGVAVQGADALTILPFAAGTLLIPRVAADATSRSAALTATVSRHLALVMGVACGVSAVAAWWIVPWFFGDAFRGSVVAFWILLPGVWLFALEQVLHNDLAGRDYPAVLPAAWALALAMNLGLNVALLPRFGIAAAAASSTVAYGTAFLVLLRAWRKRFPEIPARELFLLGREELRALVFRGRIALLPAGPGEGSVGPRR